MNDIDAIIVTHNNAQTIEACLKSLAQVGITTVVVIDNASTDDTVKKITDQTVTVVHNTTNLGFGSAVNQAAQLLQAPYLLCLNPDAVLEGDLKSAVNEFRSRPHLGILGISLHTPQGTSEPYSYGSEPSLFHLITRKAISSSSTPPAWVSGAALMVRRHTWEALHGFDPNFFMYWEDVDFCRRARQQGWEIDRTATLRALHQRGKSSQSNKRKTALYDTSADRYYRKHYPTYIWGTQYLLRRIYRFFYPLAR